VFGSDDVCQGCCVTESNPVGAPAADLSPLTDQHTEPQITELQRSMREFLVERDWDKFQDPKSLVLALVGEVGELAELFQWLPADQVPALAAEPARHGRIGEEIADVLLYLLRLADVLDVDVMAAARAKQLSARAKYPAAQVHGVAPDKV